MKGENLCPKCGGYRFVGVQYRGTAQDWDGVSEWRCEDDGTRIGRWTGNILTGDELEPIYGIPRPATHQQEGHQK